MLQRVDLAEEHEQIASPIQRDARQAEGDEQRQPEEDGGEDEPQMVHLLNYPPSASATTYVVYAVYVIGH